MTEAVPATFVQIDGAVDLTEILAAHIKGFYGGLTVLHKFDDPNLPENIANGTIQVMQGRALPSKTLDFSAGMPAGAVFSRASTALVQNAAGVWSEVAEDVARIHPLGDGIIHEPTRTNAVQNPRFEGGVPGVIGAGGTLPANMSQNNPAGLVVEFLGLFMLNGMPRLRMRYSGTATATLTNSLFIESTIPAAVGQTWAFGLNIRTVAQPGGNLFASNTRMRIGTNANGNEIINNIGAQIDTTDKRFSLVGTTFTAGANNAIVSFVFNPVSGQSYDHTFEIGLPMMELGGYSTSPMLPPVGSIATSTRASEILTTPWEPGFAGGTIIVRGKTTTANSAPPRALVEVGDGSTTDYASVVVQAGFARLAEHIVAGGVPRAEQNLGAMSANTPIVGGITFRGAGIFQMSGNGSPTVSRTESSIVVNRARLGGCAEAGMSLMGTIKSVTIFDLPLTSSFLPFYTVP